MTRKLLFIFGGLAICGLAAGCWWISTGSREPLKLPGTVEIQEVRLSSRVGGRVLKVTVREGQIVEPGQALVHFETPDLAARRAQLQAQLYAAQANFERINKGARPQEIEAAFQAMKSAEARWQRMKAGPRSEDIEQARAEWETMQAELARAIKERDREALLGTQRASSSAQWELANAAFLRWQGQAQAAKSRLKSLETGYRSEEVAEAAAEFGRFKAQHELLLAGSRAEDKAEAAARVQELEARLREIDVQLDEAVVTAPEKAVVEVLAVRPGDVVGPNQPVVRVLRAEDLWVKAYLSEVDLGKVHLGQRAQVTCDAFPGKRFDGEVAYIASISEFTPRNVQSIDERRHQVFAIKVRVTDPKGVFKAGMAADVFLDVNP